eukprot:CAMPEP_0198499246 /NCGR_PEP_ID=MMETSP1462-20131121/7499_1 /TAXON_ID=1333877 /ORGANISM="Brandtodinium nutriculum, Strain RCC3387" /LENGTH=91 /DNA_ID=CAMNT_0044228209 /DNA_START=88 /DNA_END=364 /DNA_ORIENTATION=-
MYGRELANPASTLPAPLLRGRPSQEAGDKRQVPSRESLAPKAWRRSSRRCNAYVLTNCAACFVVPRPVQNGAQQGAADNSARQQVAKPARL